MKTMKIVPIIVCVALFFVSCSKDGEDGAIGPQGPQGQQGEQGITGEAGPQGEAGTANVIYSDWIPSSFTPGGGLLQKVTVLASTDEVNSLNIDLDTSTVLVYGRGNVLLVLGDEVFPLPYVTGGGERYTYTINDGQIRLVGLTSNVANNDFDLFDDYRYLIIPGGQSISGSSGKSSKVDFTTMSYEEVVAHFKINP